MEYDGYARVLEELGHTIAQQAREAKRQAELAESDDAILASEGRLAGFRRVVTLMQQQTLAFPQITLQDLGLESLSEQTCS